MAGVVVVSDLAQADHPQLPDIGGAAATEPFNDSAATTNSMAQPQDKSERKRTTMAIVTDQTYTELAQIAEKIRTFIWRRCSLP